MQTAAPFNENAIEAIVRRGFSHLAESIYWYWPARGNNEIAERNQTLHAGRAFAEAGFVVSAECSNGEGGHLDMLALHIERRTLVTAEAKRLYSPMGAKGLATDFDRQLRFDLFSEFSTPEVDVRYRVLLATTWNGEVRKWWAEKERPNQPEGRREGGWDELGKALKLGRAGDMILGSSTDDKLQYGLYLIARDIGPHQPAV
jgi:hypothetical protein